MPSRLSATDTAFFICDIQAPFLKTIYSVDEVVSAAAFLLNVARELEVPCVVTEQYPEKLKHTCCVSSFSSLCSGLTSDYNQREF